MPLVKVSKKTSRFSGYPADSIISSPHSRREGVLPNLTNSLNVELENVLKSAAQSPDQVLFITGVFPSGKRANYAVDLAQE